MNCPKCDHEMSEEIEERWTGKYNNVLSVIVFYTCPNCYYGTDSTEATAALQADADSAGTEGA